MIIVITVVMLMTLIPLAIFTQAVQQLPLARHDQDHEVGARRGRGRRRRLPQPARAEQQLLDVQRDQSAPPTATRRSPASVHGARSRAPTVSASGTRRHDADRRRPASSTSRRPGKSRNVMRTVKVGLRRQGFLDYLWLTDYEIIDPALSGRTRRAASTARGSGTGDADEYGPEHVDAAASCTGRPGDLNGPVHSNDGLYVCGDPTLQRRHRHVLQLADEQQRGQQHAVRWSRTGRSIRSGCANAPIVPRINDPAERSAACRSRPRTPSIRTQADGTLGGTGCLYTGPTTITLKLAGASARWT